MNTMTAPSSTTATQADERTEGQTRQLENILRNALAKKREESFDLVRPLTEKIAEANPNREQAQQSIDRGNELVQTVNEKFDEMVEALSEKLNDLFQIQDFADEDAGHNPKYNYPNEYNARPSIEANVAYLEAELTWLRGTFPQLANEDMNREFLARIVSGEIKLPEKAERWSLLVRWQTIAPTYGEAVETVFGLIGKQRAAHNYRAGELGDDRIRRINRTEEFLTKLAEMQGNVKILIVPDQFGKQRAGESARRARYQIGRTDNEFGYGAFEVGLRLYLHPERLVHFDNLWIDCAGDEYDYVAGGSWQSAPVWVFGGGLVEFGALFVGDASSSYGSASGFLPQ